MIARGARSSLQRPSRRQFLMANREGARDQQHLGVAIGGGGQAMGNL
jgi:hypothetical protein